MVTLYFVGQFVCLVTNGKLKRYEADRQSLNSCSSSGSIVERVNDGYMKDDDVCVV